MKYKNLLLFVEVDGTNGIIVTSDFKLTDEEVKKVHELLDSFSQEDLDDSRRTS